MAMTIDLYNSLTAGGCCGMEAYQWNTLPWHQEDDPEPEPQAFILPDGFDVTWCVFGKFIVVAGTNDQCKLSVAATGEPMLTTPDGKHLVLERA